MSDDRTETCSPLWRCRVFGHKWGAWIGGSWHAPNFGATRGALSMLQCKRRGRRWSDDLLERRADFTMPTAEGFPGLPPDHADPAAREGPVMSDDRSEAQNFTYWFVEWPSTHVNAGRTVEVMPRSVHETEVKRLREAIHEHRAAVIKRDGETVTSWGWDADRELWSVLAPDITARGDRP